MTHNQRVEARRPRRTRSGKVDRKEEGGDGVEGEGEEEEGW